LAFAYGALQLLLALEPAGLPRLADVGIRLPALLFTLGVSLLASLLFGCVPIFKYARVRVAGRSYTDGRERHRARHALVVVQVCLAFVLLVCAGLMIRTFRALLAVKPGFAAPPAEVQTFRVAIPEADVGDPEKGMRLEEEILAKVPALPGVGAAALPTTTPMDGTRWSDPIFAQDRSSAEGELPPIRRFEFVSPELPGTLGIPLVAGRSFTWQETY